MGRKGNQGLLNVFPLSKPPSVILSLPFFSRPFSFPSPLSNALSFSTALYPSLSSQRVAAQCPCLRSFTLRIHSILILAIFFHSFILQELIFLSLFRDLRIFLSLLALIANLLIFVIILGATNRAWKIKKQIYRLREFEILV